MKQHKKNIRSLTYGLFMKNSIVLKMIHPVPQHKPAQSFDIMLEGSNLAVQFLPLSYHMKFPRAAELKLEDLKSVGESYHRYILLVIDVEDKNNQVVEIQKLALRFDYRLMIAWGNKDAKDLIDDFTSVY